MVTVAYVSIYLVSFILSRGSECICQNLYLMIKSRSCKPYLWRGGRTYCSFAVHCTLVLLTLTCLLLFFCCVLDELVSLYDVLEFLRNNWSFIIAICFTFFFFNLNKIVLFSRNAFFEIKYVEIFSRCTFVVCCTCMFQNVQPHSHSEHCGSHVTRGQYQSVSGYRYLIVIRYNQGIQIL